MKWLVLTFLVACAQKPAPKPTYLEAERLFEQHKFIESSKILSQILDETPKLPGARNLLARCFFFLGNPDRSFEELKFVLANSPIGSDENLDALFLMGAVTLEAPNLSLKHQTNGKKAWELYLKVAPNSKLREQVAAGLDQIKALENPEKATQLARSYVQSSQALKALAIFERILKKHPNYAPAWHYQGMAFIMAGEPTRAVQSWREVLRRNPAYAKKFKLDERIRVAEKL